MTDPKEATAPAEGPDAAPASADSLLIEIGHLRAELADVRAAEERYRMLVDGSPDVVSLHALDGSWAYVSASSKTLLGYDPDWLIGRDPGDLVHPQDLQVLREAYLATLESGTTQVASFRARRGDGSYIRVEGIVSPVFDDSGQPVQLRAMIRDVTDRVEAEQRFRLALEEAPIGMALQDLDGRWVTVNRELTELTGYSEEQLRTMTFSDITHPDDLAKDLEFVEKMISGKSDRYEADKRYIRPDGTPIWVHLSVSLLRDANDSPQYLICHIMDITVRREREARLTTLALTDPLTGLANRRLLHDRLGQARRRRNRSGGEIALVFVDLDGLKATNDRFGHGRGDSILQEIANRLTYAVRDEDTVARYGGDEFVVVAWLADGSQFPGLLHRLETMCSSPVTSGGEVVLVGASVGGVIVNDHETAAEALSRADEAMYEQKVARRAASSADNSPEPEPETEAEAPSEP